MDKARDLIRNTKKKFLIFSIVGVLLLIFISLTSLSYYNRIVKKQESIQNLYSNIGKHLEIVNKVGNLSDNFDDYPTKKKLESIRPEFLRLINQLKVENQKLNALINSSEDINFDKFEQLLEKRRLSDVLSEYFSRAENLVDKSSDSFTKVRRDLKFLTRTSRTKLLEIFNYISRRVYTEQKKSLVQLHRVGTLFAALCILQVILIWLLVFKPLYNALMDQNNKLVDAILKSKSASRSKTDFLANISHEIRTPMTAILGYADLLRKDEGSKNEQEKSIEIINENASHLLSLVDEILDISKVEAGKFECELEPINLSSFMSEVYALVKVKAEEKGIELIVKNSSDIPEYIDADPKRLKQILINLIGNAIKFTNEGSVTLNVSYKRDRNKLIIKVIDTGVGIPTQSITNLFKPFSQGDTSVSRKHGGTGLGLVLSKGLANAMGGDIKILESRVGIGTTFALSLSAGEAAGRKLISSFKSKKITKTEKERSGNVLEKKKILVVDDAKENARLFSIYLSSAGADVLVANGGEEAITCTKSNHFDIILLDLQMPGKDGFQTIKEIRDDGFKGPVVALTAHAMAEEKVRTMEAGFNGHITKPVTSDFLVGSVENYLNL